MANSTTYILTIIFSSILLGGSIYLILTLIKEKRKKEQKEMEIIQNTKQEYKENYIGSKHEEDITPQKSIIDLLLQYHKKELLKILNLQEESDLNYVVLTYLNDMMENTPLERYPFWTILHKEEAEHALVMLQNILQGMEDEEYLKIRDAIFAWLNYVFELDKDLVEHRDYISKEDMIKIIGSIINTIRG